MGAEICIKEKKKKKTQKNKKKYIYIYIYIYIYSIRFAKPGGPETQHQTSFPTLGCQLEDVSQMWCQLGHLFASFWSTFDGSKRLGDQNGTRKHPGQKNVKFRPLEAPESYLLFSYFLERCPSKGCFLSMCFAGVVLYRICLDSWTPRTPIIRLKRCRVVQNQGFANLGKVRKSCPPDTHFDVIFETFGHQNLTF